MCQMKAGEGEKKKDPEGTSMISKAIHLYTNGLV